MTMCLILDRLPIAVRPTPVAHPRAALAPRQPRGPMRRQIRPPARPVAVLQAAMAQPRSDSAPSTPPSPRRTSTPCTEEAMSAKVPSGPPSPSLADSSLEVRQILRDQAGHCPHTFPIPEADECSKAKGNCTEASSTARYQPVAIARARRAPSRTIRGIQWCQSLCSKQAERQYSNIQ